MFPGYLVCQKVKQMFGNRAIFIILISMDVSFIGNYF